MFPINFKCVFVEFSFVIDRHVISENKLLLFLKVVVTTMDPVLNFNYNTQIL